MADDLDLSLDDLIRRDKTRGSKQNSSNRRFNSNNHRDSKQSRQRWKKNSRQSNRNYRHHNYQPQPQPQRHRSGTSNSTAKYSHSNSWRNSSNCSNFSNNSNHRFDRPCDTSGPHAKRRKLSSLSSPVSSASGHAHSRFKRISGTSGTSHTSSSSKMNSRVSPAAVSPLLSPANTHRASDFSHLSAVSGVSGVSGTDESQKSNTSNASNLLNSANSDNNASNASNSISSSEASEDLQALPTHLLQRPSGTGRACIVYYNGTFAPPHVGHIEAMLDSFDYLRSHGFDVCGIYMSPCWNGHCRHKLRLKGVDYVSHSDRINLCQMAINDTLNQILQQSTQSTQSTQSAQSAQSAQTTSQGDTNSANSANSANGSNAQSGDKNEQSAAKIEEAFASVPAVPAVPPLMVDTNECFATHLKRPEQSVEELFERVGKLKEYGFDAQKLNFDVVWLSGAEFGVTEDNFVSAKQSKYLKRLVVINRDCNNDKANGIKEHVAKHVEDKCDQGLPRKMCFESQRKHSLSSSLIRNLCAQGDVPTLKRTYQTIPSCLDYILKHNLWNVKKSNKLNKWNNYFKKKCVATGPEQMSRAKRAEAKESDATESGTKQNMHKANKFANARNRKEKNGKYFVGIPQDLAPKNEQDQRLQSNEETEGCRQLKQLVQKMAYTDEVGWDIPDLKGLISNQIMTWLLQKNGNKKGWSDLKVIDYEFDRRGGGRRSAVFSIYNIKVELNEIAKIAKIPKLFLKISSQDAGHIDAWLFGNEWLFYEYLNNMYDVSHCQLPPMLFWHYYHPLQASHTSPNSLHTSSNSSSNSSSSSSSVSNVSNVSNIVTIMLAQDVADCVYKPQWFDTTLELGQINLLVRSLAEYHAQSMGMKLDLCSLSNDPDACDACEEVLEYPISMVHPAYVDWLNFRYDKYLSRHSANLQKNPRLSRANFEFVSRLGDEVDWILRQVVQLAQSSDAANNVDNLLCYVHGDAFLSNIMIPASQMSGDVSDGFDVSVGKNATDCSCIGYDLKCIRGLLKKKSTLALTKEMKEMKEMKEEMKENSENIGNIWGDEVVRFDRCVLIDWQTWMVGCPMIDLMSIFNSLLVGVNSELEQKLFAYYLTYLKRFGIIFNKKFEQASLRLLEYCRVLTFVGELPFWLAFLTGRQQVKKQREMWKDDGLVQQMKDKNEMATEHVMKRLDRMRLFVQAEKKRCK